MALTGYKRSCVRKSGGVRQIALIEAGKIESLTYDDASDSYSAIALEAEAKFVRYEFSEDEAALNEKTTMKAGTLVVEHTLSFELGKMDDTSRKAVEELVDASYQGIVALVTTNNGHTLVVGYSEEFGLERALCLESAEGVSGKKLSDSTKETVVLSSTDTARARVYTGNTVALTD